MCTDESSIIMDKPKSCNSSQKNCKKRNKPCIDNRDDKIRKIIHSNLPHQEDCIKDQSLTQPIRKTNATQILISQPMRSQYADLLPDYMRRNYSLQQKTLLKAQSKLDEHLQFLKVHRGRKKGEFFNRIRQSLIDSAHFFLTLSQIKQILFLCPNLYNCERQLNDTEKYDILISKGTDQPNQIRKDNLRRALNEYLNKFQGGSTNSDKTEKSIQNSGKTQKSEKSEKTQNTQKNTYKIQKTDKTEDKKIIIVIPERKFQFQQNLEKKPTTSTEKIKQQKIQQQQTINPFDILNPGGTSAFKEKLYRLIKEKEERMKALQKIPKTQQSVKFTKKQYLSVLDIIHIGYISKNISSMFKATVLGIINKQSTLGDETVIRILQILIRIGVQHKYIKIIQHEKGNIMQIDKKRYSDFRKHIETINNQQI